MQPHSSISASKVFLFSNDTIRLGAGANITSNIENECTTGNTGNLDLFQCIPTDFDDKILTKEWVLGYFNAQYDINPSSSDYAKEPKDLFSRIMSKWNVYLLALNSV